jgi:16S rRNA (adenine1518-N6/adenine1519-N6)-dimethyltransferase
VAALLPAVGTSLNDIPGRAEVRRLLADHGLAADKRRGQNFVVDANTVRAIVRRAEIRPGEPVVEIGPGLGALTRALVEAGARVTAVEVDAGLVAVLRDLLADTDVRLVHADALKVDWETVVDRPAALVANLPYNVATPLVIHALASGRFTRLHVMVQREVGQRWAAGVGDAAYGGVSVKLQTYATVALDQRISRRAFYPVPGVDSVTVRLTPVAWRADVPRSRVAELVDRGFAQRRKQLRNALASAGYAGDEVANALTGIGREPTARAEVLALDDWVELTRALG